MNRCLVTIFLWMMMVTACRAAHGQDVLIIHGRTANTEIDEQMKGLVDFFGLRPRIMDVDSSHHVINEETGREKSKVLAIMVSADALPDLDRNIQFTVQRTSETSVPLLIFDIDANTDRHALQQWSSGALDNCAKLDASNLPTALHVASNPTINRSLAGLDLPAVTAPDCRLVSTGDQAKITLISAVLKRESNPVLIRIPSKQGDVFFVPRLKPFDRSWIGQPSSLSQAFSSLSPFLVVLSSATGNYGWHLDGHYANFTIDDPWLVQPYGNVDYHGLLAEMKQHKFHTTIAFVPWNYDRSTSEVATLFRGSPQYYSICLHGNNHAHREFGDYSGNPLADQIKDIKQGVARMERFRQLSGVSYDRFMVFPHGIAPEATFAALKQYGFLGTANSLNVPLDVRFQTNPLFLLRPYSSDYADLLSLSRYSTEAPISQVDLAIQSFLGNPILFYAHQGFFRNGSSAFDSLADSVNRRDPKTQWSSLGDISRHLYQIRDRADGNIDVRMFSDEMILQNLRAKDATFFVMLKMSNAVPLASVTLDGSPVQYDRTANGIELHFNLKAKQARSFQVTYSNDLNPDKQNVRKGNLRVYALRQISDFRDMYLSRHSWGRALVGSYYDNNGESIERSIEQRWYIAAGLGALAFIAVWYFARRRTRRTLQNPPRELRNITS